ncbi:hypothetical protein GCM10009565_18180 [Amycolatopsis albidoflavus]
MRGRGFLAAGAAGEHECRGGAGDQSEAGRDGRGHGGLLAADDWGNPLGGVTPVTPLSSGYFYIVGTTL